MFFRLHDEERVSAILELLQEEETRSNRLDFRALRRYQGGNEPVERNTVPTAAFK